MSFIGGDEKVQQLFDPNSSGSEDNYQSDDEINSEQSISGSLSSFKNTIFKKNHAAQNRNKNTPRSQSCRLAVSLRYGKFNRRYKAKNKPQKITKQKKCKKISEKNQIVVEKPEEISKKGKRCRLGGKAKGNPPEEEGRDRRDSDDDSDSFYFGRISLGYFQKFKDKSGASTSNQWEDEQKSIIPLNKAEKLLHNEPSEEMELLELQQWGKTALVSSYNLKTGFEKTEDIIPDRL